MAKITAITTITTFTTITTITTITIITTITTITTITKKTTMTTVTTRRGLLAIACHLTLTNAPEADEGIKKTKKTMTTEIETETLRAI